MKRILGRSGIDVSAIGLGCWAIGGPYRHNGNPSGWGMIDDSESLRALALGMDSGVNFLDTADVYGCGHSEELIGKAIKGKRDAVVIATKFGITFDPMRKEVTGENQDGAYIRSACEDSLRRLKTDYIDLYQFHCGDTDAEEPLMETLEQLVEEGKIRAYGWSTDTPERAALIARGPNCCAVQQELSVVTGRDEVLKICEENNLASINRSPLAMGILSGKYTRSTSFPDGDVRSAFMNLASGVFAERMELANSIRDVLTANGLTPAQGSLAWLLAKSTRTIPIPGFRNSRQVEENSAVLASGPLSDTEMGQIDKLLAKYKAGDR
jgi:aryl-alcohol dehydrogenase-like predicted oxidoreductase